MFAWELRRQMSEGWSSLGSSQHCAPWQAEEREASLGPEAWTRERQRLGLEEGKCDRQFCALPWGRHSLHCPLGM